MIKGGKGGANTNANGLAFEKDVDLPALLARKGFILEEAKGGYFKLKKEKGGKDLGILFRKRKIYNYLYELGAIKDTDATGILSKRMEPDDAFLNLTNNTLYIIEAKFQEKGGSVDEKLQTCDYKKKRYEKLFAGLVGKVEYIYVLNDWFQHPRYEDTLGYVEEMGCHYYFTVIPHEILGL